ncbi:MAG: hypothetical protein K0Q67_2815, partial [Cellvibrio sp.]|nr:hypothetical protein [Cellvibrio sp.]
LSILNQPPPSLQPMEILLRIAAGGRPQVWDMPVIATLTVNDWKDIFLQLKGEELQTVLLYSGNLTVADSNNQFVDRKVREALGLIATENPKNKIKVDRLSF